MKRKPKSILTLVVILLFAVNTVYAVEMKSLMNLDPMGRDASTLVKKPSCHGDSHSEGAAVVDKHSSCCDKGCQTCVSVTMSESAGSILAFSHSDSHKNYSVISSPQDAHASNLYRPPSFN